MTRPGCPYAPGHRTRRATHQPPAPHRYVVAADDRGMFMRCVWCGDEKRGL